MQDIRYGLRRILQSPGFSAIVVLTLALGIGANTVIFSVVDTVLLRPLPYREPDRLVTIEHFYPALDALEAPVSAPGFRDYRDRTRSFAAVAVQTGWNPNLTGDGDPERLVGSTVSGQFFQVLGVPAALGRTLAPGDDREGENRVVVLSHGFWQRHFGGAPDAVGKKMILNGESYQVVGVMPSTFRDFYSRRRELWTPLVFTPEQLADDRRTNEYLNLLARLKPGVAVEGARAEMKTFAEQLKRQYPGSYMADWSLIVTPLARQATGGIRPKLLVLLGAVGCVLLIACVNVANLLLARAAGRLKEVSVRTALGATRGQLVRQLLVESSLLALAGGALGVLGAYWGVRAVAGLGAANLPFATDLSIDGTVLAFAFGISLLTGLLFGLAPALQTTAGNHAQTLREGGRGATADRSGKILRRVLVVGEFALALALLASAGLLLKSFARLQDVDPGFRPGRLLTFTINLPDPKYPDDTKQIAFFDQALERIAAVPGVVAVGGTSVMPFGGDWTTGSFQVEGYQQAEGQPGPWGDIRTVSPGFFQTLGIPLRRGRTFTPQDGADSVPVAVVDEEMVRRYWPNQDPIGKRVTFGPPDGGTEPEWIEVVGVVAHTAHEGLDAERRIQLYLSYRQQGIAFMAFAVRTAGEPEVAVGPVREAVRAVDRDQPISNVRTMEELLDESMEERRLTMTLFGLFAGMALLLAALGIYGVMSYSVAQRSHELGVRMALGAARASVLRLVLRQGMLLAAVGILLGLAASFGATRLVASQLFGVEPTDPATLAAVTLLLGGIALAANTLPALRATRVDPVIALREE